MTRARGSSWPTSATDLYGVIGHPISHSQSPTLHNAAFTALGIDACYVAFDVAPARLTAAIAGLGALGVVGANVTVPHKQEVVAACDELTDEARLIGAVNTLHFTDDGLVGDNTDARGFVASISAVGSLRGRRVHVLGAGGAARAVVVGVARQGAEVVVAARRPEAARELAELAEQAGAADAEALSLDDDDLGVAIAEADLVVNATPLGLSGERLPRPYHELRADQVAVDLVYGRQATPWLGDAAAGGAMAIDGLGMLVHQAALALLRWTGRDGLAAMQAAVSR